MDYTIDLLTVICGKDYCFEKWFNYIQTLLKQNKINTWIIVNNSPSKFFENLKLQIAINKVNLLTKIVYLDGPGKFYPPAGMDWRDPEVCIGKHRSTGSSFTLGFNASSADCILTIDDDIIPPEDGFQKLLDYKLRHKESVGVIGGLYFNHGGWNSDNPWRTRSQLKRTVVASIRKEDWLPAMIDDYWNKGIVESGYLGTGFTLYDGVYTRKCLPMQTIRNHKKGTIMGPDGHLCKQLRELYCKQTYVDSSILCQHYESETEEAGMGAIQFFKTLETTSPIVLCGSFKNYHHRRENYLNAKKVSEKINSRLMIIWIDDLVEQCDFIDESKDSIFKVNYDIEKNDFIKIKDEKRIKQKILDEIYFRILNEGTNYIFNFMETTDKVISFAKLNKILKNKPKIRIKK